MLNIIFFNAKGRKGKRKGTRREVGGRFFLPPNFGEERREKRKEREGKRRYLAAGEFCPITFVDF
jgi:hypothetical protein